MTLRLIHAELRDIYTQDFFGILHTFSLGMGKFRSDIRVFNSRDDGQAKAGKIDNLNVGGMFSAASTFRSDNETRINIDYTIKIW